MIELLAPAGDLETEGGDGADACYIGGEVWPRGRLYARGHREGPTMPRPRQFGLNIIT